MIHQEVAEASSTCPFDEEPEMLRSPSVFLFQRFWRVVALLLWLADSVLIGGKKHHFWSV